MNRRLLLLSALFALFSTASDEARAQRFVMLEAGATSFTVGEAGRYFEQIVGSYRQAGIRVPTQRRYPASALLSADVYLLEGFGGQVGLGVQWAQTEALALYGDYSGTLDISSNINMIALQTVGRQVIPFSSRIAGIVVVRTGLLIGRYRLDEELVIEDVGSSTVTMTGKGHDVTAGISGGLGWRVSGHMRVHASAGYRYGVLRSPSGSMSASSLAQMSGQLPFQVGMSGWTTSLGIDIPFR